MRNAPERTGGVRTVPAARRPVPPADISKKPPYSPVPSLSVSALAPCWNCACAEMMLRSVAMAAVSFADRRAARRFGIAMAAMMAMIAITIISSISVKPFWLRDMEAGLLVGSVGDAPPGQPPISARREDPRPVPRRRVSRTPSLPAGGEPDERSGSLRTGTREAEGEVGKPPLDAARIDVPSDVAKGLGP